MNWQLIDNVPHFLHVCGGVSGSWERHPGTGKIFSTYVEVFPIHSRSSYKHEDFLHVCGGVSGKAGRKHICVKFSPRMWRCFSLY